MDCDDGCNLKQRPVKKNMIAAASQGFHIFQAQTENLSLKIINFKYQYKFPLNNYKCYLMLVGSDETISLIFSHPNVQI